MNLKCPFWVTSPLLLVALVQPAAARGPERVCGTSPNGLGLNTARGELIVSKSNSLASKVIGFLGESFSHSMLSHGPGGQVTTANMYGKPGTSDSCTNPVDQADIRSPGPGATRLSNAGNYTSLYLNWDASANATSLKAKGGTNTAQIATFFESRTCDWSDGAFCYYKMDGTNYTPYSLFQYADAQGSPKNNFGANLYKGAVCSTLLAGGQYGAQTKELATKSYVMADTKDPAKNAIKFIRDQVYNQCMADPPSWIDNVLCFDTDTTLCNNAAVEVASVFVNGSGSSTDATTKSLIANTSSKTAHSISPQGLATLIPTSSWYTNGTNPTTPLWNDPSGQAYGCWGMGFQDPDSLLLLNQDPYPVNKFRDMIGWAPVTKNNPGFTVASIGGGGGGVFGLVWTKINNFDYRPLLYKVDPNGWTFWDYVGTQAFSDLSKVRANAVTDNTGAVSVLLRPDTGSTTLLRKAAIGSAWTTETTGPGARAYAPNAAGNVIYLAMDTGQLYRKSYPGGGSYTTCGSPIPADAGKVELLGVAGGQIWALTTNGRVLRMSESVCSAGVWVNMISTSFIVKWLGTSSKLGDVWITDSSGLVWNYDTATNQWYRHYTPAKATTSVAGVAADEKGRPYYLAPTNPSRVYRTTI